MKKICAALAAFSSVATFSIAHASSPFIIGGEEAAPNDWQSIVSLQLDGDHFCGGTLIEPNKVLTAAHCVDGLAASGIEILVGAYDITAHPNAETFNVQSIIMHEDYTSTGNGNDIALITLDGESNQPTANLISARQMEELSAGNMLSAAGWGWTLPSGGNAQVEVLQEVDLPLVAQDVCQDSYGIINDTMVCAGFPEGGQSVCKGDSGGPLTADINGDTYQVGIVSFGRVPCAGEDDYAVFARISAFESWYPTEEKITSSLDFEFNFGDWTQSGASHSWSRRSGQTPSSGTGPLDAADGDFYAYMETSAGDANSAGNSAHLISPEFDAQNTTVTFDYHMAGANIGTLHLDVFNGTSWVNSVWSQSGAQQNSQNDHWRKASVDLSAFSGRIQVRLRGVANGGWQGDIAIDNVSVIEGEATEVTTLPSGSKVAEYNDPTLGNSFNGCTFRVTYGTGGPGFEYNEYTISCDSGEYVVGVEKNHQNFGWSSSTSCKFHPQTSGIRASGSCDNWRVYLL